MKFPSIDKYLSEDDSFITANENSRPTNHIPDIISEYGGGFFGALKTRLPVMNLMLSCLLQAKISAKGIKDNPKLGKTNIPDHELKGIETFAKSLGVSSLGYTKVDSNMIFENERILYDNAIVFLIEMNKSAIDTAPSKTAIKEIFRTYNELGIIVNKVSGYIRELGYNAMAGPALGGAVSYVPLAKKAGLGAMGKHGLLITDKDYGPSLRIAAVYTDIENLPFSEDNPHLWINDFCNSCNKCVKSCPVGAVYENSLAINGNPDTRQCIDYTKCAVPFANNYGCTICVNSCTFYNSDYYKIKSKFFKEI